MALRDQPYLPLYVQDFLADEKLAECSAATTGVYIRLMCIMHKSEEYGKICYNKRDNKTDNPAHDFAQKLSRQMPYSEQEIYDGLCELLDRKIIGISSEKNGKKLFQKRMVRDAELSEKRAKSGKKGMSKRYKSDNNKKDICYNKNDNKTITNTENEIEYENEYKKDRGGTGEEEKKSDTKTTDTFETFRQNYPGKKRGYDTELAALRKHSDWREVIACLPGILNEQKRWREQAQRHAVFVPNWPNLQTWLNQRRWEEELNFDFETTKLSTPAPNEWVSEEKLIAAGWRMIDIQNQFEYHPATGLWRQKRQ